MLSYRKEIETFLKKFKKYWPPNFYVVPRDKNEEALIALGITAEHRKKEILTLNHTNYCKGPEPDDSGSEGDIWVFRKRIAGVEVYIKLKTFEVRGKTHAKCISFHPSQYWGE